MFVQNVNSTSSFGGKFDLQTLKLASETMGLSAAKKFRAGKNKYHEIGIVYETLPVNAPFGKQVLQTDTYMSIKNTRKDEPALLIKLADGKMSFGQEMLDLITKKITKFESKTKKH